jgi:hypothetical protein
MLELLLGTRLGKRVWIPFIGVARVASNIVHPKGVHDFQIAVFDQGGFNGDEAAALLAREAAGYTQIVHARSRGEWTFVYGRPNASGRMDLLILTSDARQTVLLRCDVDAAQAARSMKKPESFTAMGR